uniref:Uncharacterized protein n=1 Tax=Picea glauca TaxID=3330 RepID=A0A117NHP5_PICGL|nr:hypothetical protein ABT39_MTgene4665 [Picea glauca]QHR91267.1 hypothetical protein Q903MT_gene5299 [Picea sitchensis]
MVNQCTLPTSKCSNRPKFDYFLLRTVSVCFIFQYASEMAVLMKPLLDYAWNWLCLLCLL